MQTLRLGQSNDIQQNLGQIQQQMAGPNGQVIDQRAGGALAQTELVAAKDAQGAARDLAYDSARASEAFLDPANGSQIAGTILQNVRTNFSPTNAPQAFKIFNDEMLPLLESGQSLRSIFETRQILTQHAKQAGPEGAAAAAMNRQLDQQLIDQSNDLLLYGDSDAVGNWLDAISQHKDFMKKWETGGILKDLTSEGIRDGEKVLNKDSDDVANFIFGLSLNPNKTNMGRNLMTLKKELAPETWNSLRQEFFIKLSEKMLKTNGELSGQTFATAWKTIKTNKTVVNTLFTQAERANLDALASTAMRISSSAKNYSNSANSMLGALRKFMDILGPLPITKGLARLPVVSQGMGSVATAQMAVNPVVKSPSLMKRLLTTTSAVTAGAETVEGAANALLGNTSSATSFGENK